VVQEPWCRIRADYAAAPIGMHLARKNRYLQLDEASDSTAHSTFRVVTRREANGE
jgi:hypothetical protein